ncbi:hypothetical protein AMJ48_02675 [Parcubacteria bacterium DG_74_1]|nr:MAG: hypothetical protein AMJ48_02675 [Parcubacteria bacterium DG_74_1]
MVKKVFDISPPKKLEKKKVERFIPEKKPEFKISPPRSRMGKKLILIPLVLVIVGVIAYFSLSRAEIEICPETEIKIFETRLTVDKNITNIDFSAGSIPGVVFEETKTFPQEFPSSGEKSTEKRAEGVIRIFNDYQNDQILVAQTRFQAPLEKFKPSLEEDEEPWFKTVERVVVPAKGYIDVRVVADAPGEKYNIEPSTFSVPGLAGTPQYTLVYGKSSEAMSGGSEKDVFEVTQEDLEGAEKVLIEKATEETKNTLKGKVPEEFVTLEEGFKTEILEAFSLTEAGTELEKFTFQVKARTKTLFFKEEDLENFSKEFIATEIATDKNFDQETLKIEYSPEAIDLEGGEIMLSLKLKAKIYSVVDETSLRQALAGKSLTETQFFLQNQPEVIRAEVKLWPFWVQRVPENFDKIKITIAVDPSPISE